MSQTAEAAPAAKNGAAKNGAAKVDAKVDAKPEVPFGTPGTTATVKIAELDLKTVRNSRLRAATEAEVAQLAASIKAVGPQQLPSAYYDAAKKRVVLVSGNTRKDAALMLGQDELTVAFVEPPADAIEARLKNGAENLARRALHPIEIAAFIGDAKADGVTDKQISKMSGGLSTSSINNYGRFYGAPFFKDWCKRFKGTSEAGPTDVPGIRVALDLLQAYPDSEKKMKDEAKRVADLHAAGKPYRVAELDGFADDADEEGPEEGDAPEGKSRAKLKLRGASHVKVALDAGKLCDLKPAGFEAGFFAALRWVSMQKWTDADGGGHGPKSGPPWEWEVPKQGRKKAGE